MAERRYDPQEIEPRWQAVWERERTWEVVNESAARRDYGNVTAGIERYALELSHERSRTAKCLLVDPRRFVDLERRRQIHVHGRASAPRARDPRTDARQVGVRVRQEALTYGGDGS